jgi:hypothetical protein
MNIQEEKTYILSENNTAQQQLIDLLDTLNSASTVELNIEDALSGALDFSVLGSMGFTKIRKINLGKGKITSIDHIPNTVTKFNCSHNILMSLKLPPAISELNCSHNHISDLELEGIHHLTKLNCEYNELTQLDPIPESIREIECSHNHITRLDLNDLTELRVLHCSHNKLMIIQNLPIQLEDFRMDNNPMAEIEHIARNAKTKTQAKVVAASETKIDYIEGLHEYFRLKNSYYSAIAVLKKKEFQKATNPTAGKRKANAVKPKCINCKRPVGSIFAKRDDKYIALCGDKDKPCNLNIQIYSGFYINTERLLYMNRELLDDSKEAIIRQKLDTLFNYISELRSAALFKKELDNYNETSQFYKDYYDKYEQTYNNMHKRELIVRKNEEIYELLETIQTMLNEYEKTNNSEILKTAVQMQMDDLMPKLGFLRRLKYEIMEMVEDKQEVLHLVQREVALNNMDFTYSEPGRVVKYMVGS